MLSALLSIFVLLRKRWETIPLTLFLGLVSVAFMEFANFLALKSSGERVILWWKSLSFVAETLLVYSWLIFSILFGKEDQKKAMRKWKWILPPLFLGPAVLLTYTLVTQAIVLGDAGYLYLGTAFKYFHISLLAVTIVVLVNLENTFRSSAGVERWRIKYLLFGIGAILCLHVYFLSQRIIYSVVNISDIHLFSCVIIVSIILISFSIIRDRVIDNNIYISRRVIYSSISLIAIGLYSIVIALIAHFIKRLHLYKNIKLDVLLIFFAILVMILLFYWETLRRKIKTIINRHFRKSKYVYRDEWMVFSTELSKKIDTREVCETFMKNLSERLLVKHTSIWLSDDNQTNYYMVASSNLEQIDLRISHENKLLGYLFENNEPQSKADILGCEEISAANGETALLLEKTKAALLVPILHAQRQVGILTLGKLQTGEDYDEKEDYDLLKSVAAHAASVIDNARLFEENLRARELETFNRLSSFIMHDLKNATYMLDMVAQNAKKHLCDPEFQKDAMETISGAVARMKKMISSLSHLETGKDRRIGIDRRRVADPDYDGPERRNGYELQFKDLDLNAVIDEALERLPMNGIAQVSFQKNLGQVPLITGDVEYIYKVVHNLLLNACEAVDKNGKINVSTRANGDQVVFSVSDNGTGISPEFIKNSLFRPFKTTKEKGLGIGLYQCKTIVEAHGGRIHVDSVYGEGTTFSVYLPTNQE